MDTHQNMFLNFEMMIVQLHHSGHLQTFLRGFQIPPYDRCVNYPKYVCRVGLNGEYQYAIFDPVMRQKSKRFTRKRFDRRFKNKVDEVIVLRGMALYRVREFQLFARNYIEMLLPSNLQGREDSIRVVLTGMLGMNGVAYIPDLVQPELQSDVDSDTVLRPGMLPAPEFL